MSGDSVNLEIQITIYQSEHHSSQQKSEYFAGSNLSSTQLWVGGWVVGA